MKKHILFLFCLHLHLKGMRKMILKYNVVTTAVPILLVSPDSRAGAWEMLALLQHQMEILALGIQQNSLF